jgi:hypothetical protein
MYLSPRFARDRPTRHFHSALHARPSLLPGGQSFDPSLIIFVSKRKAATTSVPNELASFPVHGSLVRPGGVRIERGWTSHARGHVDLDQLDHWLRVGWERARGASEPYPDSED